MKIDHMETIALSLPIPVPFLAPGNQSRDRVNPVITKIKTTEGLEAFGVAFTNNDHEAIAETPRRKRVLHLQCP